MKANELRIGNLVTYLGGLIETTSRTILNIDEMNLMVEPIPLTEERLLKFGFERDKMRSVFARYNHPNFTFYIKHWKGEFILCHNSDHFRETEYVHELQNAIYSMTSFELTTD